MNTLIIIAAILLVGMWYIILIGEIIDVLRHKNRILEQQNKLMEQANDIQQNALQHKRESVGYKGQRKLSNIRYWDVI